MEVGKNEAITVKLFIRSLTGEALNWYTTQNTNKWAGWTSVAHDFMERFMFNIEATPDRFYLEKIEKKSMDESEMTTSFIRCQKGPQL